MEARAADQTTDLPSGTVTFLFTDIESSTHLLKELGPPRYGDVLSAHNRIVRAAFTEFGGAETHHQGDSFVAVFSSAGAAVRAAATAQRALAAEAWPESKVVRVRMGIHTGEARLERDGYVGMAVHDASRIGDAGHGGQVLLSTTTARLVQDDLPEGVGLRKLGPTKLAEGERTEMLCQLEIAGLAHTFPPPASRPVEERAGEPLLERDAELTILGAVCEAAAAGSGRVVIVEGPLGIGKTRLVAAARELAEQAGMRPLAARAGEFERDFSYGVLRQLVEPALALASREEREELLSGAAELAAPLFDLSSEESVEASDDDVTFATLHGLYWLAANLAAQTPLAFVIDDLHWCDAPSLRFLAYLVKRMEGLPVVVVAGLRPAEPGVDEAVMAEVTGDARTLLLRPSELSPEAAAVYLRSRLGEDAADEFCAACYAAVGGNPLLLRELATRVAADGVQPVAANARRVEELGPRAVARAILMRLARLSDDARALLRAAAVVGDGADLRLAAELAELDVQRAAASSAALIRSDLLAQRDPVGFAHSVVRAAVYEDVPPAERAQLHRRAADLLVADDAVPERVAAHLLVTSPAADPFVVEQLRRAAALSLARGAADAAVAYLRRALDEPPAPDLLGELLRELGLAERLVDTGAAVEHLGQAVDALADPVRRGDTALAYGRALVRSNRHEDGLRVFERALEELGDGDRDLAESLHAELVGAASFEPHLRPIAERELATVREDNLRGGHGTDLVLSTLAYHLMRRGVERERAVSLAQRSLESGSLDREAARAFFYATYTLDVGGEVEAAQQAYDTAIDRARRRGDVLTASASLLFRGIAALRWGNIGSAEEDLRESIELGGFTTALPYQSAFLAELLIERGELDEATEVHALPGLPEQLPVNGHLSFYLDSRARLRYATARYDDSLRDLETLGRHFDALGIQNPAYVAWRAHAAEVLVALERREEALELAREELELSRIWGDPRAIGVSLRAVGLAESGEQAVQTLRGAVDLLDETPAKLEEARALIDLGVAERLAGERDEARAHLRRGLELAELAGATRLADQARTGLTATGVRPRPVVVAGIDSLTTSERRVAELARAGQTSREIAQALFVTPNTVESHLASVYRKLGVTSRSELDDALSAIAAAHA